MKYNLPQIFEGVEVFSSEVSDGYMSFETQEGCQNVQDFLKKSEIKNPLCHMLQIHSNKIVDAQSAGLYENVDGLITQKSFSLAVRSADCIPVMIYDQKIGLIGAIHAGRRGILTGILSQSLKNKLKKHKSHPADLAVFLGPHIRFANYNLKSDITSKFKDTKWEEFISGNNGKAYFDLTRAARSELEGISVKAENIIDCGIDTFTDERFFSVRRTSGDERIRFLTVVYKK